MAVGANDQPTAFASYVANAEHGGHAVGATRVLGLRKSIVLVAVLVVSTLTGGYINVRSRRCPKCGRSIRTRRCSI